MSRFSTLEGLPSATPPTATGRKDDAEKTRYDLIPPRALDALARVLTFGARKYSQWGACTCGADNANATKRSTPAASAELATNDGSKPGILNTPDASKSTRRIGVDAIPNERESCIESPRRGFSPRTPTHTKKRWLRKSTGSRTSNISISSQTDAPYADRDSDFTSTTVTRAGAFEAVSATRATSVSDSSNAPINGLREHTTTCGVRRKTPGDDNWRKVPDARRRYFGAALRHTWAWWRGERLDAESGEHHLAHALCCIAFALELDLEEEKTP